MDRQPLKRFTGAIQADIRHIQELVREHEVGKVLVGLPLPVGRGKWPPQKVVEEFIQLLEPALSVRW